jgi:hypothetical protein
VRHRFLSSFELALLGSTKRNCCEIVVGYDAAEMSPPAAPYGSAGRNGCRIEFHPYKRGAAAGPPRSCSGRAMRLHRTGYAMWGCTALQLGPCPDLKWAVAPLQLALVHVLGTTMAPARQARTAGAGHAQAQPCRPFGTPHGPHSWRS